METPIIQEIYREGELIATPSNGETSYLDEVLSPNRRYEYRLEVELDDGSAEIATATAATLAYPPRVLGPTGIGTDRFSLAIIDEMNPPGTEYRASLRRWDDPPHRFILSDWDASRCRTFDDLSSHSEYGFEVVARNLDGVETDATRWVYNDVQEKPARWTTRDHAGGADDQRGVDNINATADIYGLAERARAWMLSDDSPINVYAGGYYSPERLMHWTMIGFFEHWTGFPEPCGDMNIYTYKRDVARFMLDFRGYERSGELNPLARWRLYYNALVGNADRFYGPKGERAWGLLERGDYDALWGDLYYVALAELPKWAAGKLSLLPPTIRRYFEGFIAEGADVHWVDEMHWYNGLSDADRRLWDKFFLYHGIIHHSPRFSHRPISPRSAIPGAVRRHLEDGDRQMLVAFVNALENVAGSEEGNAPLWESAPGYWVYYVAENMIRSHLYVDDLSPRIGVELESRNLEGVKAILRTLARDFYCGAEEQSELERMIETSTRISELQRAAFLSMIEIRERNEREICRMIRG